MNRANFYGLNAKIRDETRHELHVITKSPQSHVFVECINNCKIQLNSTKKMVMDNKKIKKKLKTFCLCLKTFTQSPSNISNDNK